LIGLKGVAPVERVSGSSAQAAILRRAPGSVRPIAVVLVMVVSLAVGCSSATPGGPDAAVVVPVLWASDASGDPRGGVEAVGVRVAAGGGALNVDLTTEQAQGAGPQWVAASGSAAMVGALASAADPRTIDIGFTISGPIDGPSGGAALTVGVLAAIRGLELRDGVTMTGTISPDGSVGRVALVPTKVRAAAEAGYSLMLVPQANGTDRDPDTGLDVVALGQSLGMEVRPVANIGEATAAFTGQPVTAGGDTPPPLNPVMAGIARQTATAMVDRLATMVAEADGPGAGTGDAGTGDAGTGDTGAGDSALASEVLAQARAALDAGDDAAAYGAASEGVLGLARARAAESVTTQAATGDLGAVRTAVAAEAAAVVDAADRALAALGPTGERTSGQQLNLPAALGWLTYARAAAQASSEAADLATGATQLGGLAGTIAEQRVAIEVMWPDARDMALAVDGDPAALTDDPEGFLDGYTQLLITASEANEQYLEAVLAGTGAPLVASDPVVVAAGVLADLATGGGPAVGPVSAVGPASAVVRASAAMSWWFVTAEAVAGRQAFGLDTFGLGDDVGVPASQATLDAAVRNAADTVAAAAGTLAQRGVDPSAQVWSAGWGQAAAAADGATAVAAGEVIALGELWYSTITAFLLLAASAPPTPSAPAP